MKSNKLKPIIKSFSLTEKTIFYVFAAIFVLAGLTFLYNLNEKFLVEIPEKGGSLVEGMIGTPRLINPLVAVSETDKGLVNLIYSGLLRSTPDGLVPDLAERYEVSEDGLQYHFYLKEDIEFHDGTQVTADDVIFTILSAQNPVLKSSKRSNWEGISIEKINDKEIIFTLKQPYAPFLQNLTLGILPKAIWGEIDINEFSLSNFNVNPIGSGPYEIKKIRRDSIGIPTSYELKSFADFALGEPNIETIKLVFAKNQDELIDLYRNGDVDSIYGINPQIAREFQLEGERVETFPLPRVFGLFMNQDEASVLGSKTVRKALQKATPKLEVVDEVLSGFATVINSPIPTGILDIDTNNAPVANMADVVAAEKILTDAGWKRNEDGIMILESDSEKKMLSITITTSNIPELSQAAEIVADSWRKIGADVKIETFEPGDLNSNIIRPRKFEVLLFGLVIGRDLDFYAFWHSSQRDDPGLNITGYANIEVDKILEDIRNTHDTSIITDKLKTFDEELKADIPAIFLYSPDFIYILPKKLGGLEIGNIVNAEERFLNINTWYTSTDKVWKFFVD